MSKNVTTEKVLMTYINEHEKRHTEAEERAVERHRELIKKLDGYVTDVEVVKGSVKVLEKTVQRHAMYWTGVSTVFGGVFYWLWRNISTVVDFVKEIKQRH